MKRIVPLAILIAALVEFSVERARFDLWIITAATLVLLPGIFSELRRARTDEKRRK